MAEKKSKRRGVARSSTFSTGRRVRRESESESKIDAKEETSRSSPIGN